MNDIHKFDMGDTVRILDENGNPTGVTGVIIGELSKDQIKTANTLMGGQVFWPGDIRVLIVCGNFGEDRSLDFFCPAYLDVVQPDYARN